MRVILLRLALLTATSCAAIAASAPVHAQPDSVGPPKPAPPVEAFENGAQAFQQGRFEEAIEHFEVSYALEPEPILLYNIARAYEGLDRPAEALEHYRRYLEAVPEAKDRGAVEARMDALRSQIARREELAKRSDTPTQPPPARSPAIDPWIIAGVGGAAIIGGGIVGAVWLATAAEAHDAPVANDAVELADEAELLGMASAITLVVGGALAVGGTTWGLVDILSIEEDELSARLRWRGSALSLEGSF